MEHEFWHRAWDRPAEPGWQQIKANHQLQKHWASLGASTGDSVFVPLCGRSPDIQWLLDSGMQIIGVDLSLVALKQFCVEAGFDVDVVEKDGFTVLSAAGLTLYAGDFFKLPANWLKDVGFVYDRAAQIALPAEMRVEYARQMRSVLPANARILLLTIAYQQSQMKGPPFSVTEVEVRRLYETHYQVELIERESGPEVLGNLKQRGLEDIEESVYHLLPLAT